MKTVKGIVVAAAAVAAAVCASSCSTSRILVGDVKPKEPMIEVSKEHNAHFLGGLVKTGKTIAQEHVGDAENYAVLTRYGFGDIMLSFVTGYIYTPTTTKYYIPVRYMDDFDFVGKEKQRKERVHKDGCFHLDYLVDLQTVILEIKRDGSRIGYESLSTGFPKLRITE